MDQSTDAEAIGKANVRLCRLRVWSSDTGLGFTVEAAAAPPHVIRTVDSNSPAAASGLKILDVLLAVNNQDVSQSNYNDVRSAIQNARAANDVIELLVVEQRFYSSLKNKNISIDPALARVIESPPRMPSEYKNFPKNTPRTCEIRLKKSDTTFGFEIVNGPKDVGVIIQEVTPNMPASRTTLRKSDRVLEVDDIFVDSDPSRSILEKIGQAKAKGAVKLYVVDTHTYKYFNENQIPLSSKEFKKGKYEKKLKTMSHIEQGDSQSIKGTTDDRRQPSSKASTLRRNAQSNSQDEINSIDVHTDDIRLCTIIRASATDSFGMELNYQIREQLHIIKFPAGINNGISNAALAGVKVDDRLIEINGQNVQNSPNAEVKQRIRSVQYPDKLRLLVADKATYDYYKAQNKTIHSGLPSVRHMAENMPGQPPSSVPASRRPTETSLTSTSREPPSTRPGPSIGIEALHNRIPLDPTQPMRDPSVDTASLNNRIPKDSTRQVQDPSSGLGALKNQNPLESTRQVQDPSSGLGALKNQNPLESSRISTSEPYNDHKKIDLSRIPPESVRRARLQLTPDDSGYGFNLTPDKAAGTGHQLGQITPLSPADRQGLRAGDYIISVNNENVERMSPTEFNLFLRKASQNAKSTRDGILLFEVVNEDALNVSTKQRTPSHTSIASRAPTDVSEHYRTSSHLNTTSQTPTDDDEPYPEIRLCTVRPWPNYKELGFEIVPTSSTGRGNDGYQIQQLRRDSPAAHTNIHNGDHLIEINSRNIEGRDLQYVQQCLNDSYNRESSERLVKLLVVDDTGYQWYKNRRLHIDTSGTKSNVKKHETSAPPSPHNQRDNIPSQPTDDGYAQPRKSLHVTSPISRPQKDLSRAAIHVVSGKDMYRFCRLTTDSSGTFGFDTEFDNNKHLIQNVIPDSSAAKAGLNNGDGLIEVSKDDIRQKSHREVQDLLNAAIHEGVVHLLIMPSNIKPLTSRSAKSLTALNDQRYYRDTNSPSPNDDQHKASRLNKHRSTLHINGEQSYSTNDLTEPLPRRCLLVHDPSFRGYGFRVSKKESYDTPIIVEVCPNSPAKRSGLTEGDHIIYIGSQNIQNIDSFNEMTDLIERAFNGHGQITLTTLTGPAYQLLKQRGGYLKDTAFDYQSPNIIEMKPRLCKLSLYNHEHHFGFQIKYGDRIYVRDVEAGSAADVYDIRKDDRILELNGHDTTYLSDTEINEIIKQSEKDRKLDILVIDKTGYEFSMRHAIPLNSFLPFVQSPKERATTISRTQQEAVYL